MDNSKEENPLEKFLDKLNNNEKQLLLEYRKYKSYDYLSKRFEEILESENETKENNH